MYITALTIARKHNIEVVHTRGHQPALVGLFIFRRSLTLQALREELPNKWGKSTGEHGFLYIIEHLVSKGLRVEALPIAKEIELVSFNNMEDVSPYL